MPSPTPSTAPEPAQSGDVLEAGMQIGDFRIERRLGAGGMGIVYQARQVSLNRPVALKVLGQSLKRPGDLTRFQREAQAAARLSHPGIASIYFIGQDRHICYLVMELVEGVSLRRVLDRLGQSSAGGTSLDTAAREELTHEDLARPLRFDQPTEDLAAVPADAAPEGKDPLNPYLSPQALKLRCDSDHIRRASELVRDVAGALAHAHQRGVVHRDIKPDNILLDKSGKIHVIDFGVARFFDDLSVTYTGQLVGTPLYMSPEQVTGRGAIDPRTDVYSLGLVLYELLTLRAPLEANNREFLLRTIVTKALPPVNWRNPAVPDSLLRIVHKATQKDPDQRYATAAEMAQDLNRFLAGQSVAAPPYHFRLDEREITAARPGSIVVAAFVFFVTSFFLFMVVLAATIMSGIMLGNVMGRELGRSWIIIPIMESLFAIGLLSIGLLVGRGLLAARAWARWTALLLSGVMVLGSIGMGVLIAAAISTTSAPEFADQGTQAGMSPEEAEEFHNAMLGMFRGIVVAYSIPPLAILFLAITAIVALSTRPAREWFSFARQVRLEHQRLREALS